MAQNEADVQGEEMEKCGYCGKENGYEARYCTGCATPLIEDPDDPRLSAAESLEMLRRQQGEKESQEGFFFFVLSLFAGHPLHAFHFVTRALALLLRGRGATGGNDKDDRAKELLEAAAHYESLSPKSAIALYRQIISEYPGTRMALEAERNIETLTRHGA